MPLGTVLVALLGVGIAEYSGMISAALRGMVMNAPKKNSHFSRGICWYYVKYCR